MPVKPSWRLQKRSTATSFAALSTAGRVPPTSPARRARPRAGKRSVSGSSKVSWPILAKFVWTRSLSIRSGYNSAYWMGRHMSGVDNCAMIEPSTYSTIECTTLCG